MRVPSSTYRIQFHHGFRLAHAKALADYLSDLGITDLYASPLLAARAGSSHGYDVTNPAILNPELGTLEDLTALSEALQGRDMGLVLDIVPNHMAASIENPWWRDILSHGSKSAFASFFDIDWNRKLMLPVLPQPYGEILEKGGIQIHDRNGSASLEVQSMLLPVTLPPDADLSNPAGLDRVLAAQPYRLAYWRKAADSVNYRRFFDINDLVGLRTDRDDVFRATHDLILGLVQMGVVTGLRIDHIDGLLDPEAYLDRLPSVYIVVEKILGAAEPLPHNWRVWGTTGYDFVNIANGLFVDRRGYEELKTLYALITRNDTALSALIPSCKRKVMETLFAGELTALMQRLADLAGEHWTARDFTAKELREAFIEVTSRLPVYRTYLRPSGTMEETDRYHLDDALAAAARAFPSPAYAFLRQLLLAEPPHYLRARRNDWIDFVMRWQQFTGPLMAKGLEDTCFYLYNPLVSLNEVGGDATPESSFGVEEFHRLMQERRTRWPFTMNAGSTHDTKRSEDVRARINVLSELAPEWGRYLKRWSRWNDAGTGIPDKNEESLLYQSMLGAWPIDAPRLKAYITKALREAKVHTSWINTDENYEGQVMDFIDRILEPGGTSPFLGDFQKFQRKVAFYGAVNSLAQTVLRMTAPGVPDFYQGQETWNFSLADPDNRRPVDYEARKKMLEQIRAGVDPGELVENWIDGRIKMYVIWKTLNFRRANPDLFLRGDYIPLRVVGFRADHLVAFARRYRSVWCVTVVPRLVTKLTRQDRWPLGLASWSDTGLELSETIPTEWTNVLTGERWPAPLLAAQVLGTFPVAVLRGQS